MTFDLRCANLILVAISIVAAPGPSDARQPIAEDWISETAVPALLTQLSAHPRFKGESVRVVVFVDGKPAPLSNALAISFRDKLADAIIAVPDIRISPPVLRNNGTDCTRNDAHYYVGLQISRTAKDRFRIDLRALDLEDQAWVAGFDPFWEGSLSRSQQRAFDQAAADTSFLGERSVPFSMSESDMIAASLARELGCASLRQMTGEYLVLVDDNSDLAAPLNGIAELISNNLAAGRSLQFTSDPGQANAILTGKAHTIDADLHQYWATVAPLDPGSELPALNASTYVRTGTARVNRARIPQPQNVLLSSTRLTGINGPGSCNSNRKTCIAMQVRTGEDAVVFFLNHQVNHGLVRLSGPGCRPQTDARVVRAHETISQPLPLFTLMPDAASRSTEWSVSPDADTYYAIAVNDSKAAHILSRHLQKLPQRCSAAVRFGLEGEKLENWMSVFAQTMTQWRSHIDWQAIRVRNVY